MKKQYSPLKLPGARFSHGSATPFAGPRVATLGPYSWTGRPPLELDRHSWPIAWTVGSLVRHWLVGFSLDEDLSGYQLTDDENAFLRVPSKYYGKRGTPIGPARAVVIFFDAGGYMDSIPATRDAVKGLIDGIAESLDRAGVVVAYNVTEPNLLGGMPATDKEDVTFLLPLGGSTTVTLPVLDPEMFVGGEVCMFFDARYTATDHDHAGTPTTVVQSAMMAHDQGQWESAFPRFRKATIELIASKPSIAGFPPDDAADYAANAGVVAGLASSLSSQGVSFGGAFASGGARNSYFSGLPGKIIDFFGL